MKNKKYHTVGSLHVKFNMTRKEKGDISIGVQSKSKLINGVAGKTTGHVIRI